MKRKLVSWGIASLMALCGGCGASTQFQPADGTKIRELLEEQRLAWNRGDIEAFMEGYAKEELVFTSGGTIRKGWQDTLDRYRARYGDDKSTMGTLSFEVLKIQSLGADGAVVLGRWKLEGLTDPAGGVFSVVLARERAGWRIVHDHTSSDPKPEDGAES